MNSPCHELAARLGELFVCSQVGNRVRVRTPMYYPDGDVIDLYYEEGPHGRALSDLGETLGWLRLQTGVLKRSPKQRQMLQDACLTHGVELFQGMLTLRLRPEESIAAGVIRLAQAAVRVSDLWFTSRVRSVTSVTDEIAEFLTEREIAFERGVNFPGRSNRTWSIDFHTRGASASSLVCVLATGSRAVARKVAEHALATWYDLAHLRATTTGLQFVSLFDDTLDVWTTEDLRLVEDLSTVAHWSRPDEFAALLAA